LERERIRTDEPHQLSRFLVVAHEVLHLLETLTHQNLIEVWDASKSFTDELSLKLLFEFARQRSLEKMQESFKEGEV